MTATSFEQLERQLSEQGVEALFDQLLGDLTAQKRFHELFDAMLMRSRRRLGLAAILSGSIDELTEPLRSRLEDAYLTACREVGGLLLGEGKLREAWMYLRPVGDKAPVAEALAKMTPDADNLQDMIEIALHEGVAPVLGFELVLSHYGTCNAITTFEGAVLQRPRADQQAAAALLLRRLQADVVGNVRADIARHEGREPGDATLAALVADRDWLFADHNYHIDTTHLAATVRFARLIEERELLELAYDLTEYGRRLSGQFQFAGDEPFAEVYASHGLFFAAQLGHRVAESLDYFRQRAESLPIDQHGAGPAEVYIALLARLCRYDEAIEATLALIPPNTRTSGFAPSLHELARRSGQYDRLLEACRQRGDLVGFAAGLLESKQGT